MSIFADDFLDLMPSTITVERLTGRSDDGLPSYAAAISYRAHIANKTHNVLGANNQIVVARGMMWLDTADAINADDRVTLPDGTRPVILVVNRVEDENGGAGTRLDFQ